MPPSVASPGADESLRSRPDAEPAAAPRRAQATGTTLCPPAAAAAAPPIASYLPALSSVDAISWQFCSSCSRSVLGVCPGGYVRFESGGTTALRLECNEIAGSRRISMCENKTRGI